ncbi:hypothetical protein SOV_17140 [Sporomusa ovata DSM 2662]|uniref:Uncharacterized protein n=1 Tax=Sporomusa ovata TaxID=2378 RepID=A0A0U1KVP5_9FIRM|nr:hypothetical protein [Sporomusa ovata]EQB29314.1 hypothetical protein SOV_1c10470 [Sporomusa ovata DSM 2662]CQR71355.1 hypothetical protein SpAn4DRAFT_3860 [Sporomusa ovata]
MGTTLKPVIIRLNKTQLEVSKVAKIPKNRMTELVNQKGTPPKPEEIQRLCVALDDYRQLGYQYCSNECKLGRYLGYQYGEIEPGTTGLSIISNLFGLEQMLGELARMLCNNTVTSEMMARLSQIKLSIMALEIMYSEGTLKAGGTDMVFLTEYIQKEKNRP